MKVLQLGKFYPVRGGVEKVMYDLTLGLSEAGVDCDMLCACIEKVVATGAIEKNAPMGADGSIRLNSHGRILTVKAWKKLAGTMIAPSMIGRLRRIAREYDIIHVHHPDPMAALALFLSGFKGKVVLHWHSDILSQKALLTFYKPLQNWLIRRSDLILGTTPVYVEQSPHLAAARSRGQRIDYLPIGVKPLRKVGTASITDVNRGDTAQKTSNGRQVSTASDDHLAEQVAEIHERYGNRRIIYSLGRLVPYKGYSCLIDAAAKLPDDCVVLIGGTGPLKDELQERIDSLALGGKVHLLGRIDSDWFDAYYNACDLFCLSSIWKTEAFAIVQIEAMSLGKPVVATRIPESGVSWVNADGVSGLNAAPADSGDLARRIMQVLDRQVFYSAGAARRYEENFTFDKMITNCLDKYRGL